MTHTACIIPVTTVLGCSTVYTSLQVDALVGCSIVYTSLQVYALVGCSIVYTSLQVDALVIQPIVHIWMRRCHTLGHTVHKAGTHDV